MVSSLAGDFDEIAGVVKDGEEEEEVAAEVIVNVEKIEGSSKVKGGIFHTERPSPATTL